MLNSNLKFANNLPVLLCIFNQKIEAKRSLNPTDLKSNIAWKLSFSFLSLF